MTTLIRILQQGLSLVHSVAKQTLRKIIFESTLKEYIFLDSLCMIAAFVIKDLMGKIVYQFICTNFMVMLNKC